MSEPEDTAAALLAFYQKYDPAKLEKSPNLVKQLLSSKAPLPQIAASLKKKYGAIPEGPSWAKPAKSKKKASSSASAAASSSSSV